MPIPLFFIAASAITATYGAGKTIAAGLNQLEAEETNEKSESIISDATEKIEKCRVNCANAINNLGVRKITISENGIKTFVEEFQKLNNVDLTESVGLNELQKLKLDEKDFAELKEIEIKTSKIAEGMASGAMAGAITAFGAYGAAKTFAKASTGTAISLLKGGAKKNATLAFFGGGSKESGGWGISGGTAILGGLIAAPALAVYGTVLSAEASANKDDAYSNLIKATEYKEEMDAASSACMAIRKRSNMLNRYLISLNSLFEPAVYEMKKLIEKKGTDYSLFSREEKEIVVKAANLAKAVKSILDTAILDNDGNLTKESEELVACSSLGEKFDLLDKDCDNCDSDDLDLKDTDHAGVEVFSMYEETYNFILDQLASMTGRVDRDTESWIDRNILNVSNATAVAVYNFPNIEVLFTLTGLNYRTGPTNYGYIPYDKYDQFKSKVKEAKPGDKYDSMFLVDESDDSVELYITGNEGKVLKKLFVTLKSMPKPSDDKIVFYHSKEHENFFDYILLMVEYLKMGNLEPFFVMRLFSDIIDYEDVDQDVFEEMAKIVIEESRAMTKEQFIERARYLIYNEKLASRYNNTLLFINDLVVLLQYATGKVSQYNGLYSDILKQIYETCFDEDDSSKYDDFIRICEMPYKFINYLADMDELRKHYNNIDDYVDINHMAFVGATKTFWVGVRKILDQDYGIFTSKDKRMGLLQSLFVKRWDVEEASYLRLLGRINNIKNDKLRNKCYKGIDSIIAYPDEEMNDHFCKLVNEYKITNLGPEEILGKYKEIRD